MILTNIMMFYGTIIFEKLMFRGGGRRGGGCRMFEDVLPHSPGVHFYGAVGLSNARINSQHCDILSFF